jgi:hypothetical protein
VHNSILRRTLHGLKQNQDGFETQVALVQFGLGPMKTKEVKSAQDSDKVPEKWVKTALVRCKDFRCLAYLDSDGKWKDAQGNVLEVVSVETELPFKNH